MKTFIATFIIASSCIVYSKPLEALVSCNCSQWVMGKNGGMVLATSAVGTTTIHQISEKFSNELVNLPYSQKETTKTGYESVTPGFAKLLGRGSSIFSKGDSVIDFVSNECKKISARDEGYINCAVSITFPINENAKELSQ